MNPRVGGGGSASSVLNDSGVAGTSVGDALNTLSSSITSESIWNRNSETNTITSQVANDGLDLGSGNVVTSGLVDGVDVSALSLSNMPNLPNTAIEFGDCSVANLVTIVTTSNTALSFISANAANYANVSDYSYSEIELLGTTTNAEIHLDADRMLDGGNSGTYSTLGVYGDSVNGVSVYVEDYVTGNTTDFVVRANSNVALIVNSDSNTIMTLSSTGLLSLTGNVDCGGQQIVNVGNVDGVDIAALATTSFTATAFTLSANVDVAQAYADTPGANMVQVSNAQVNVTAIANEKVLISFYGSFAAISAESDLIVGYQVDSDTCVVGSYPGVTATGSTKAFSSCMLSAALGAGAHTIKLVASKSTGAPRILATNYSACTLHVMQK